LQLDNLYFRDSYSENAYKAFVSSPLPSRFTHLLTTYLLNPLDYHVWGAMLDKYQRYVPKPTNISELKTVLKAIWSDLPQGPIKC